MQLPKKGEKVSVEQLIELIGYCFDKPDYILIRNLEINPPKSLFVSDGCSMFPDRWLGKDIYSACFWHDVRYWCGIPGDEFGRFDADLALARDVAKIVNPKLARLMFIGVSVGGIEKFKTSFKWGYGRT